VASGAAKRYAQAVLELAKERNTLDEWQVDLARLAEMMRDPSAEQFLENPNVPEDRKREVVNHVLAQAQPEARNLAQMLIERGRLGIAPRLAQIFDESVLAERGMAIADVTTAEPLGPEAEAAIRDQLSRLIGKQIQMRTHVDESIIGGIVARVGDQLIDGSVINQLRRLRARLAAG